MKLKVHRYIEVLGINSMKEDLALLDILYDIGVVLSSKDYDKEREEIIDAWSSDYEPENMRVSFALYDDNRFMMFEREMAKELPNTTYSVTQDPSIFKNKPRPPRAFAFRRSFKINKEETEK